MQFLEQLNLNLQLKSFKLMLHRNNMETDRKRKISLPAAIFNKSPSRNSENSSMISNTHAFDHQYHTFEDTCYNHPNKKGRYLVLSEDNEDDDETLYCQKCAILLASRGFEVKKIETEANGSSLKRHESSREQQLQSFIKEIHIKLDHLGQAENKGQQILARIKEKQEQQLQMIQEFFDSLKIIVQKKKSKMLHSCSVKNRCLEEDINENMEYINQKKEVVETMRDDIESSLESIIKNTPEEDYRLVMTHYSQNLSQIGINFDFMKNSDFQLPPLQIIEQNLDHFLQTDSAVFFSFQSQIDEQA